MIHLSKTHFNGRPEAELLTLPERVLQFGTGALLRGLPDFLIDQANRQGIFNGRIVVVKSTDRGDTSAFDTQDHLYTVCVRGIQNGVPVAENIVSAAISRVLSAREQWADVLACAANPLLEIVISNTTEVGIQLVRENIRLEPPASFPGKLLAFLLTRYRIFNGDPSKGLVIVPTELVPDNGDLLESIVLELAHLNNLEYSFIEWLENACTFCNSLADRIVPGMPAADTAEMIFQESGYRDDLLILTEPYCLWAIQGDEKVARVLSFHKANPESVVISPDIERYRERKLRLLNGTHTLSCGLAHLAGFATVHEAMQSPDMAAFIRNLMLEEIAPAIPYPLPPGDAMAFGEQVLDRFRNPFFEHKWLSITVEYAAKMRMRIVPLLQEHFRKKTETAPGLALGFAAFICFYRNPDFHVQDQQAAYLSEKWKTMPAEKIVQNVLADQSLWGADLSELPGFADAVGQYLAFILEKGALRTLQEFIQISSVPFLGTELAAARYEQVSSQSE